MHAHPWSVAIRSGLVAICLLLWATIPGRAAGKDLAVLVVGKSSDSAMAAQERTLIEKLTQTRAQRGWNHRVLPIYSYHFDKSVERSYCEDRLKVKAGDLIVVGIVELENGVPVSFVHRENGVRSPEKVAEQIMDRARSEMVARGITPPTAKPSTAPSPARTVAATPPARPSTSPSPARTTAATPVRPATSPSPARTTPVAVSSPPPVQTPARPSASPTRPATRPSTPVAVSSPPPVQVPVRPSASPSRPVTPAPARTPGTTASPSTATPPVAVQTPPPNPNEKWAIQVGLVSTLDKARTLVKKLREEHKDLAPVEIRKGYKDGKVVFRVLVGLFHGQAEAFAKGKELKEAGIECFSVRIEPSLGQVVR